MNRAAAFAVAALVLVAACSSDSSDRRGNAAEPAAVQEIVGPDRGPMGAWELADVAGDVGLDFRHGAFRWEVSADPVAMMGGGLCWIDFDDDGWLDLYVVSSWAEQERARWLEEGGLPRNALFRNVEGRFVDVSAGSGADLAVRGSGCVAADFDGDGRTDLYVTTDSTSALLWNEGGGRFVEAAAAAGAAAPGWRTGAAAGDVNGDGRIDLFLAGYVDLHGDIPGATQGFPNTNLGVRDLLYLNEGPAEGGHAQFLEVGVDAGLEVVGFEYGLGARFADLDRDGDLDLYVANDTKPNRLYDNVAWPGGAAADPAGLGFRFEELAGRAGVADPNAGMGVAEGDFDTDGRPDLFVTNARGQLHAAYRGQPPGAIDPSFLDVRATLGPDLGGSTGWGATFLDLDLDTDLDLLYVNGAIPVTDLAADAEPVLVLRNLAAQGDPRHFEPVDADVGLHAIGSLVARGSAAADFDNDGDLDVAVNVIGGALVLLENRAEGGGWLEVELEPFRPGTLVTVTLDDGSVHTRESAAGSSYLSSEDPRLHFGLGDAAAVDVVVTWPGGAQTTIDAAAANRRLVVREP